MNNTRRGEGEIIVLAIIILLVIAIPIGMYGCPHYNVYEQQLSGEAELQKAESTRKVAVLEAQAKMDSATLLANAEIARAKGVAEANKIIGDSLKGNEAYLHYLWIHNLENTKDQVIYIPTEANMPIMEAGRFNKQVEVIAPNVKKP